MMYKQYVRQAQKGFTLTELMVTLAILAALAAALYAVYDPSRSSGQRMISNMGELGSGLTRMRTDVGCYPKVPAGLFDPSKLTASNMFCGTDMTTSTKWQGPYISRFTVDGSGNANFDNIASGVVVSVGQETGGIGKRYYLRAANVPNDIIIRALNECNSTESTTVTFDTNKCRATTGTGQTLVGTFDVMFDETK